MRLCWCIAFAWDGYVRVCAAALPAAASAAAPAITCTLSARSTRPRRPRHLLRTQNLRFGVLVHVKLSLEQTSIFSYSYIGYTKASLAQLVEHRSRKAGVTSSSLVAGSSFLQVYRTYAKSKFTTIKYYEPQKTYCTCVVCAVYVRCTRLLLRAPHTPHAPHTPLCTFMRGTFLQRAGHA